MPSLTELDGQFIAYFQESAEEMFKRGVAKPADMFRRVDSLAEAHGVRFLCPKDYAKNGGKEGAHTIQLYFTGSPVPPHLGRNNAGQTVRWTATGSGLADLRLSPSIQEEDDLCKWHGFVGNGGVPPGFAA